MGRYLINRAKEFLIGKLPRKNPVLQEHFFRQSLAEIGIWGGDIKIDHIMGKSHHAETGWVPIVFPESLILYAGKIPKHKSRDFFFRGMIYEGREWVRNYDGSSVSDYGRDVARKYTIDEEYYESLCASRFGLAPTGDCPWSYRFFEAVMCHAIPVLGATDVDVFCESFRFYREGDPLEFKQEWCEENRRRLLEQHTLRGLESN